MSIDDGQIEVTITKGELREWESPNVFNIGGPDEYDIRQMLRDRGLDPNKRPLAKWTDIDGTIHFCGARIKREAGR